MGTPNPSHIKGTPSPVLSLIYDDSCVSKFIDSRNEELTYTLPSAVWTHNIETEVHNDDAYVLEMTQPHPLPHQPAHQLEQATYTTASNNTGHIVKPPTDFPLLESATPCQQLASGGTSTTGVEIRGEVPQMECHGNFSMHAPQHSVLKRNCCWAYRCLLTPYEITSTSFGH